MPDTSPATDAGAGAEALLGLAAGHQVRLPSLNTISNNKPSANLRSTQQRSFLPTPPSLQLPEQSPPPIRHFPPPAPALPSPATDRLPTISEWVETPYHPLPPPPLRPLSSPDRLTDRWQQSSSLPTPYAYAHSQPHWQPHPRSHSFPQPAPPYYFYNNPQPQPLSAPYTMPSPPLHPSVTPLPPPLALPVPRSDSSQQLRPVAPIVQPIPALDRLCEAAVVKPTARPPTSLPCISHPSAVSGPITQPPPPNVIPPLIPPTAPKLPLPKPVLESKPQPTPSRARGLADLINPTNSPPRPGNSVSGSIPTTVSKPLPSPRKVEKIRLEPQISLPPIKIVPACAPQIPPNATKPSIKTMAKPQNNVVKIEQVSTEPIPRPVTSTSPKPVTKVATSAIQSSKADKKFTTPLAQRNRASTAKVESKEQSPIDDEDDDDDDDDDESAESEETRCPCGSSANSGTMIACDDCNTWQHSRCMGFRRRNDVPENYYCNLCRPLEMRVSCVAHPKYKEKHAKDREARDSKRDIEPLLANIKPVDLRKLFANDFKHRKSLLKAGKEHIISKYASYMKTHFSRYRQGVVDGLSVLLDMPRADVNEKLDAVIRKMRLSSNEKADESTEKKRSGALISQDGLSVENAQRFSFQPRGGAKRQRPPSLCVETLETTTASRSDNALNVEGPGDIEMNDYGNSRGMSREDRKLREAMRLFARMEEREKEKKRPRIGEPGNSPRSGLQSRPKTPRSASYTRITSPVIGTPSRQVVIESSRGKGTGERGQSDSDEGRSAPSDRIESHIPKVSLRSERPDTPENLVKSETGKSSSKGSSPSSKGDPEPSREGPKRERHKAERQALRRKEGSAKELPDLAPLCVQTHQGSIFDRNRDAKRRRITGKDGYGRSGRDNAKRDPALDTVVVVPGPSVLGSTLVPKSRMSSLQKEVAAAQEADNQKLQAQQSFPLVTKDSTVREDEVHRMAKMNDAAPMKKRFRTPLELYEEHMNSLNAKPSKDKQPSAKPATVSVSMIVVSEKDSLPDKGEKLESSKLVIRTLAEEKKLRMARKKFCLKKRSDMLTTRVAKDKKVEKSKNVKHAVEKELGKISPVSPNSASQSTSPTCARNARQVVPIAKDLTSPKPTSPIASFSPRLRSSPVSCVRIAALRSAPIPESKRILSPSKAGRSLPPVSGDVHKPAHASKSGSPSRVQLEKTTSSSKVVLTEAAAAVVNGATQTKPVCSEPISECKMKPNVIDRAAGSSPRNGEVKASEKFDRKLKMPTPGTNTNGAQSIPKVKSSGDAPKRTFQIPLSKPIPLTTGLSSEGSTPTTGGVRKGLGLGASLGLRSVRPEPVVIPPRGEVAGSGVGIRNTVNGRKEKGVSPALKNDDMDVTTGECTISDILQKRLEGFCNPGANGNNVIGVSGISSVDTRKGNGLGVRNGGIDKSRYGGAGNGLGRHTPPSALVAPALASANYRNKMMDNNRNNGGWGVLPSFANSKRPHGPFHSGRSAMAPGGNNPNVGSGGKGHHHHHHHHGRKDEKKNGLGGGGGSSKNWGNHHSYRGGYAGAGSGRGANGSGGNGAGGASSSNDGIGRGGRRRRHE